MRCVPGTWPPSQCRPTSCRPRCSNNHSGLNHDPEDSSEQLVVVGERTPGAHKFDIQSIADDIRAAIAVRHGVTARDVILVPAGAIPRTSSGKVGHAACRAAYIDGTLRGGYVTA